MSDDLGLLRSFVAVAEELHFGRAARRLHIAQPPLSMRIKRLEAALDVRLLERSRRHVALTEAGVFLLERARALLAEAERARIETQRVGRGEEGVLCIGYTPTATFEVLPRVLAAYRARRPRVRLELREMRSPEQPDALRRGRIELGFVCAPVASEGLAERVLAHEGLVLALPERHPLASRRKVRAIDLEGLPFVRVRPDVEPGWAGTASAALRRHGVSPEVVQETDGKIAQLGLVAAGIGCALVSESMTRLGRAGVVYRPVVGLRVRLPLTLLSELQPSPRATELIESAAEAVTPRVAPVTPRRPLVPSSGPTTA